MVCTSAATRSATMEGTACPGLGGMSVRNEEDVSKGKDATPKKDILKTQRPSMGEVDGRGQTIGGDGHEGQDYESG